MGLDLPNMGLDLPNMGLDLPNMGLDLSNMELDRAILIKSVRFETIETIQNNSKHFSSIKLGSTQPWSVQLSFSC